MYSVYSVHSVHPIQFTVCAVYRVCLLKSVTFQVGSVYSVYSLQCVEFAACIIYSVCALHSAPILPMMKEGLVTLSRCDKLNSADLFVFTFIILKVQGQKFEHSKVELYV